MRALFKSLQWLEPVVELVRLGFFLTFVALLLTHLLAVVRAKSDSVRRRWANLIIAFVLVVTSIVGVTQIDTWPFSNWALVHMLRSPVMHAWQIEGIDASGHTYVIDPSILEPVSPEDFAPSAGRLRALSPSGRTSFMRFLYKRAEEGRRSVVEGKRFPANRWLLGRFSAPYHFGRRQLWRGPRDVPNNRFASIRMVFTVWNIDDRMRRGDAAIEREVIAEYRADE